MCDPSMKPALHSKHTEEEDCVLSDISLNENINKNDESQVLLIINKNV